MMKTRNKTAQLFFAGALLFLLPQLGLKAQTWNSVTSGTTQDLNAVHFTNTTTGFIVGNTGTIRKSTDGGNTWTATTSPITNNLMGVNFADAFSGYACGGNGRVIRTVNAGAAWSILHSGLTPQTLNSIKSIVVSGNYAIITVGDAGVIYVSPNNGGNWSASPSGTSANLYGVDMATGAMNAWAVGANGTIISTSNGGSSWSAQTSGTTNTLRSVFFISAMQGWAVGDNGTIRTTTNGGATWTTQTSGTTQNLNDVYFASPTTGWAVGNNGTIIGTMNGGATWTAQTSNTTSNLLSCHIPISCRGISVGATGTIRRYEFIPSQPTSISGSATVCAGTSQTYSTPTVIGATSYTWILPSGWTGTSTTNSITTTAGSTGGTISVVANGDCGASIARTLSVTVNTIPAQPASISGNTTVCSSTSQTYSVSPVSGATSYTWTLPSGWGGTSTLSTINATSGTTSGSVSVIANNSCGNSMAQTISVLVNTPPAQPSTISGNATVCPTTSNTYSIASVSGATSYTWSLPSGWSGSSTTNSIVATAGSSGGTISVTANNSCGSSSAQNISITIGTAPAQPGSISGSNSICAGATQTYSVSAVSGATSYNWLLPAGWSGSSTTNSITVTAGASSGTVSVAAVNACGSSTLQNLNITIENVPAQPGSISGSTQICEGATDTYSISSVSGATSYTWTLSSGWTGSSTTNSIIVTSGTSIGTISVTADNACGSSASQSIQVDILPIPDNTVTYSGGILSAVQTGATYQWVDCSDFSAINGETNQTFQPTLEGDYAVEVTLNGCPSISTCTNITFNSIDEVSISVFNLYPNPSSGLIYIESSISVECIEIFDLSGKLIWNKSSLSDDKIISINPVIESGVYFLVIKGEGQTKLQKICRY